MHSSFLIALLAGLGGMLGWGSADFFAKKVIDRIGPIKSLVWAHVFGTAILLLVFLTRVLFRHTANGFVMNVSSWTALVFFGVLQMIVYWLVYQGFEKGQLSILNPVFASYSGLVALISILFFGERAPWLAVMALIVIFGGNLLLNVEFGAARSKRFKIPPGLMEVALAALLAAGWTLGWDKFVTGRDALASALGMYAFMSLAALALARLMKVKAKGVKSDLWKFLFLMGLGEAIAYLSISWGYSKTSLTGVVALISGAFSVPTVILAYLFLKERLNKVQFSAIVTIIVGVVLLSIS